MKTLKRFLTTVMVIGAVAAVLISTPVQPMMGPGMMGPGPWGNLTKEQRNNIAKIQEETRKKQWDLMGRMREEQFKLQ